MAVFSLNNDGIVFGMDSVWDLAAEGFFIMNGLIDLARCTRVC